MSDNNQRRELSKQEQDQREVSDWLNGDGAMYIAAIFVFIVIFAIVRLFL
jgi:hypothetical protein